MPLREVETRYSQWVADQSDGDKNLLAKRLEISIRTVYHWISKGRIKWVSKKNVDHK
jgi:hypothetical protein